MQQRQQPQQAPRRRGSGRVVTATGRLLSSREQQEQYKRHRRRPVFIWQRCFWICAVIFTCAITNPANEPYTIMSFSSVLLKSSGSSSSSSSSASSTFWNNNSGRSSSSLSITNYGVFAVRERRTSLEFWAFARQPLWTCSFIEPPFSVDNESTSRSSWHGHMFQENNNNNHVICESLRDLLCHGKSSSVFFQGGTSGSSSSSSHDMSFITYRIVVILLILGAAIVTSVQDAETLYYSYDSSTTTITWPQRLYNAWIALFVPDERDVLGFLFWNVFDAAVLVFPTLQRMDQLVALQSHKSWFRILNADYHYEIPVLLGGTSGRLDASQVNYIFSLIIFFSLPTLINALQSLVFHTSTTTGRHRMIRPGQQQRLLAVPASSCFLGFELVGAVSLGYLRGTKQEHMRILLTKYSVDLVAMAWIRVISVTLSRAVLTPTPTTATTGGSSGSSSSGSSYYSSLFYSACGEMVHVLCTWTSCFVAGSILGHYQYDNQVLQTFVRDIWKEADNVFNALFDTGR